MKRNSKDEKHKLTNKLKSELVEMIIDLREEKQANTQELCDLRWDNKNKDSDNKQLLKRETELMDRIKEIRESHKEEIGELNTVHGHKFSELSGKISGLEFAIETLVNRRESK